MLTSAVALVLGLAGLTVAGTLVVRAASEIGLRFGMSPLLVGLTVVALGTSAPELAVSIGATSAGDPGLAVGNVVGSNIANVLLVLGLTAALGTVHVTARVVRVDVPVMIGVSVLFVMLSVDGSLGRADGLVLASGAALFVAWTLWAALGRGNPGDALAEGPRAGSVPVAWSGAVLVVGIGLLIGAARLVVGGAEGIAVALGVPDLVVGLTVVALGTSAPELATSLVAAARGERDLAVGNAIGSNVFNILLVLGVTALVSAEAVPIAESVLRLDLPIMTVAAIACLPVLAQGHRLERWEGTVFVAYYVAYLVFLGLDATGHGARDPFAVVMVGFVVPLTVITLVTIGVRRRRTGGGPVDPAPASTELTKARDG